MRGRRTAIRPYIMSAWFLEMSYVGSEVSAFSAMTFWRATGASKNDQENEKCSRTAGMGCLRARKWVKGNKSSEKKGMAGRKNRGESGNDSA